MISTAVEVPGVSLPESSPIASMDTSYATNLTYRAKATDMSVRKAGRYPSLISDRRILLFVGASNVLCDLHENCEDVGVSSLTYVKCGIFMDARSSALHSKQYSDIQTEHKHQTEPTASIRIL